ncbi:DUF4298 domain-containing protein [Neisseria leonii]|uniref:DUF4298 domain-containing protein n=1 Tax=Neisseria leonii TaxID=2995413 RepID=A0A9X4IB41_9NEIS|nr:DUF4298 domain-containing protein [Neisseria sp. 51.81]MDD9328014.1 DUF4298 domain-containing protein [Neisseria sp. 51.81]
MSLPTQERLQEIQDLYREWMQLLPKLKAARCDWQRGEDLMRQLADFYFGGGYLACIEAEEQGQQFDLDTQGEYSILSEDAVWNAVGDQQTLAWQWLRDALETLDRDGNQSGQPLTHSMY